MASLVGATASAQTAAVAGAAHDETGGALPGVTVELRPAAGSPLLTTTNARGAFRFDRVAPGHYETSFTLINFASTRRGSMWRRPAPCVSMRCCTSR